MKLVALRCQWKQVVMLTSRTVEALALAVIVCIMLYILKIVV